MTDSKDNKKKPDSSAKSSRGKDKKASDKKAESKPTEQESKPVEQNVRGGMSRRTVYILLAILIGVSALMWRQYMAPDPSTADVKTFGDMGKPKIGGAFSLIDHNGRTVSEADFKGRYMLVYFGYTFCPDVCPTSLSAIADAIDLLGDKADLVTPVFITVDPERDTPEQMKMYVGYFHPKLVGLSGSVEQVSKAAMAYKAYFAKAEDTGDEEYLMDHSSITYLMGPDGEFVAHFSHGVEAEEMAARLKEILK